MGCLIGTYFYTLERVGGQLLLLSASVLTGVFMAVFGQIYQTRADAYQLFMMWSFLILGWTLLSKFTPQYIFWLAITNIALMLWWDQGALPERGMKFIIFPYLFMLNGGALALREYFASYRAATWLQPRWIRLFLTITVLVPMLIPVVVLIADPGKTIPSITTTALVGIIGHGLLYAFYRY